jgi:hypothetical protein
MLIVLIIILIGVGLVHGFNISDYVKFGVNIIDFHYPFFRFGLSYEGYTFTNNEGEIYELTTLILGAVFLNLFFSFYKQVGNVKDTQITDSHDITDRPSIPCI